MRKQNKKIIDSAVIINLLDTCPVGRLGTVGADGWPMVKPLNFAYREGRIYFHCALQGEKLDDIRRDPRVCFEVDLPIAYVKGAPDNPCRAEYLYRSVIIRGRAVIVEDRGEQIAALDALMRKYQPEGGYGPYPEEKLALTGIVRIDIEDLSGKEELGKDGMRERALQLMAEEAPLPVVFE
ncbi:pyridoxamine 5'-phosphate oxidase family protein [Geomobilimonas luticola]|uniref:Pyridoxamine 5'-phosphate oxidase family protein n=1 Tax=Geomobilimonas luticola TaxID=1114878 RepID=A0ABS5SA04_9BACT|nr:pyridoxamine 5'-phosphate oxidase family protein [Geomobilimonas luticola]MBT0652210.1 pyridoxamine 5'-phosphate oxidase family protein [Geomobilimonas luticola]